MDKHNLTDEEEKEMEYLHAVRDCIINVHGLPLYTAIGAIRQHESIYDECYQSDTEPTETASKLAAILDIKELLKTTWCELGMYEPEETGPTAGNQLTLF